MEWTAGPPTFDQWIQMFRECTRSAVHLEMRDTYWVSSEDALFNAWKAGHRDDPEDRASWWRPWLGLVEEAVSRGIEVRRARIVSEPVTEYIRFEYDMTFTNVLAGEQVRWLPRRKAAPLALPGCDFWLLDGERVMFNHFNGVGDWAGVEWTKDPEITDLCGSAFDAVWHLATPHEEYRTA